MYNATYQRKRGESIKTFSEGNKLSASRSNKKLGKEQKFLLQRAYTDGYYFEK